MSERVYMSHPDLPGQRIHVRPSGVAVRQSSGWRVDGEHAEEYVTRQVAHARDVLVEAGWALTPPQVGEQPSEPDAATLASEPRRRRRAETSEGE